MPRACAAYSSPSDPLTTDLKYDASRTLFQVSDGVDLVRINAYAAEMEAGLSAQFTADRIAPGDVSFQRLGDMRCVGQGYELPVALPLGILGPADLPAIWDAFHAAHAAEYGHAFRASPIEIVNLRVIGVGAMPKIGALKPPRGGTLAQALVR